MFHAARLVARSDAGGGLSALLVETSRDVAASYASPGQYIEVRTEGETGYFVLAGEPGALEWELIMRAGGGASDVLLRLEAGARIDVTEAIGSGFPMSEARGRRLVVALSGTGVAAARPIVRRRVADGDAARTELLVGVRALAEVPLDRDLDAWRSAGVGVTVCLSQEQKDGYAHGYVQDVIAARSPGSLAGAWILAVGMAQMIDALRAIAPSLGVPAGHVYTNH